MKLLPQQSLRFVKVMNSSPLTLPVVSLLCGNMFVVLGVNMSGVVGNVKERLPETPPTVPFLCCPEGVEGKVRKLNWAIS